MAHSRKDIILGAFDSSATEYNSMADVQKDVAQKLLEFLPEVKRGKILEVGCGTGFLTSLLVEKYPDSEVHATDLSPNMVEQCSKNVASENVRCFTMDAENPDCDKGYDVVVTSMTAQWFENPSESLLGLRGLGPVFYSSLGHRSFKEWYDVLGQNDLPTGFLDITHYPNITHEELITKNYGSARKFLKQVKGMGAGTPRAGYFSLNPKQLRQAMNDFDKVHSGNITWHIVFGEL